MMQYYSMKLLLMVTASFISVGLLYAQMTTNDIVEFDGYSLKLDKQELFDLKEGCDLVLNRITLEKQGKVIYSKSICATSLEDVVFIKKGDLTIVEHYGAPVGWSQYFIFDFCKSRLVLTKRLDEGTILKWENFIDFKNRPEKNLIMEIIKI